MKNRGRTEMLAAMLEVAKGKVYISFLSYVQLKEYLSILIENNLIEYRDGTQTYKTTEKGLHFLKMHNEIRKLLPQLL
jgi:predicted transcriptional regulator